MTRFAYVFSTERDVIRKLAECGYREHKSGVVRVPLDSLQDVRKTLAGCAFVLGFNDRISGVRAAKRASRKTYWMCEAKAPSDGLPEKPVRRIGPMPK